MRSAIGISNRSDDPSKLLESYRKVTDAALKTAAKLATRAASGPPGAAVGQLLSAKTAANFANQLAGGDTPANNGSEVAAMHDRVAARIAARKVRFQALKAELEAADMGYAAAITGLDAKIADPANNPESATGPTYAAQKSTAEAKDAVIKARLAALPDDAIVAIRDILDDHQAAIVSMQDGIAAAKGTGAAEP
jgi:hypothetical protein